jgi:hypothetical protein
MKSKQSLFAILFYLPVLFLLCSCGSDAPVAKEPQYYAAYPAHGEVLYNFFKQYKDIAKFDEKPDPKTGLKNYTEWNFEKRPDGWHVAEVYNTPDSLFRKKSHLFWSADEKKYLPLEIEKTTVSDTASLIQSIQGNEGSYNYDAHPFYGYAEWADDVIQYFKSSENLNDTLLYGLARALSVKAFARIGIRTDENVRVNHQNGDASHIPANEIEAAAKEARESVGMLEKIAANNPAFMARFTSIEEKIIQDRGLYLLQFTLIGKADLVKDLVNVAHMSEFQREFIHNTLTTCADDAIFLTMADDDTAPLLLYQQAEEFREDITFLPLLSMDQPRFCDWIQNHAPMPHRLTFTVNEQAYQKLRTSSIQIEDPNKLSVKIGALGDLFSQLNAGSGSLFQGELSSGLKLNVSALQWKIDREAAAPRTGNAALLSSLTVVEFYAIDTRILKVLDIIYTNNWKRPVEAALNTHWLAYSSLRNYFWVKGLTVELRPAQGNDLTNFMGFWSNTDKQEINENLDERYHFPHLSQANNQLRADLLIVFQYRMMFNALCSQNGSENRMKDNISVLGKMLTLFPADTFQLHKEDQWMLFYSMKAGDNELSRTLIRSMKRGTISLLSRPDSPGLDRKGNIEFMNTLVSMAQKINDPALAKEIQLTIQVLTQQPS